MLSVRTIMLSHVIYLLIKNTHNSNTVGMYYFLHPTLSFLVGLVHTKSCKKLLKDYNQ